MSSAPPSQLPRISLTLNPHLIHTQLPSSSLCQAFAFQHCTVYATARSLSSLSSLTRSNIHKLELDVADPAAIRTVVAQVMAEQGRIDILVNNAGAAGTGALLDFDVDAAGRVFEVNVLGVLRITQEVCRHMAGKGEGLVINIGSIVVRAH